MQSKHPHPHHHTHAHPCPGPFGKRPPPLPPLTAPTPTRTGSQRQDPAGRLCHGACHHADTPRVDPGLHPHVPERAGGWVGGWVSGWVGGSRWVGDGGCRVQRVRDATRPSIVCLCSAALRRTRCSANHLPPSPLPFPLHPPPQGAIIIVGVLQLFDYQVRARAGVLTARTHALTHRDECTTTQTDTPPPPTTHTLTPRSASTSGASTSWTGWCGWWPSS